MFGGYNIQQELTKRREKQSSPEQLIQKSLEGILAENTFKEQAIMHALRHNESLSDLPSETNLDPSLIFSEAEIKTQCMNLRLKFLDSRHYKFDIPYEAVLKIKYLNEQSGCDLHKFKILAPSSEFGRDKKNVHCLLFAQTSRGNYYLVHSWGHELKWHRKIRSLPLRNFETLAITVCIIAFITTMSLPTYLITLDRQATYWCGYRIATFFHLLIFYSGVTAYMLVGFNKKLSISGWKNEKEYD